MKKHFIIFIVFLNFSCSTIKPSYKIIEKNESVIFFENPKLEKKASQFTKIGPYFIGAGVMLLLSIGAQPTTNPNTGLPMDRTSELLLASGVGAVGMKLLVKLMYQKQETNSVTDNNVQQWWNKVQSTMNLKNHKLFIHNNRSHIKENIVIAIRKDVFNQVSTKILQEENARDNARYSNEVSFVDMLKIAVVAYVGYKVVKEVFNSNGSSNITNNFKNCDDSWEIDPECDGLDCYYYTCHSSGQFLRVEQLSENKYKVGAGTNVQYASSIGEAKKIAEKITSCNCK